ncbi:MAG: exopolysaccharide Pel transporter PelG [Spirochaetes bacterium]|nr:exopolysaccharide Pel transporter PelG [Spirochaetota bacterium]MBU1080698.1 exopolysaccharide Pel transporter PelG [Spirochaetota bacterium]
MAGIGFQLRKILGKGGLGGTVGAVVSGVFIVAGPWLISVVSMIALQFAFRTSSFSGVPVFQSTVVYGYACSLALFSGLHHHFTRIVSDLVWESRYGEATAWMLRFALIALASSVLLSAPVATAMPLRLAGDAALYRFSVVALFCAINVAWIVMLYVSLLRNYKVISLVFGLGMALSIAGALVLSAVLGEGGAVLGYASGVVLLDLAFIAIAVSRYRPERPRDGFADFWRYGKRYAALIASGFCFYAGGWLDKFYFWAARGAVVAGTPLRSYESYDVAVYVAGLSIIPGLVYFIIITETQLYTDLRHFLFALNHSTWTRIHKARLRVATGLRRELRDQSLLQGACTLLLASAILASREPALARVEMWAALGAAYAQFTLLTILVFLYYFELYREALLAALLYFAINGAGAVIAYGLLPWLPPGASHLAAGLCASAFGYATLKNRIYRMERIIFMRALRA